MLLVHSAVSSEGAADICAAQVACAESDPETETATAPATAPLLTQREGASTAGGEPRMLSVHSMASSEGAADICAVGVAEAAAPTDIARESVRRT